jgi:hypothetical protein
MVGTPQVMPTPAEGCAMTAPQDRLWAAATVIGFGLATAAGVLVAEVPAFSPLLWNPVGAGLVVLGTLSTMGVFLRWAHQPGHGDRLVFGDALTATGILIVVANVIAPVMGWWGGRYFSAPLLVLALLTGVGAMGWLALLLLGYRWLAARRPGLALLLWGLILLVLVPVATILGDQYQLASGMLAFGGGYTIGHDVVVAEGLLLTPILLYEIRRRRRGVSGAPRRAGPRR